MKTLYKYIGFLIVLYIAAWFALSKSEAGVLTLQIGAKQNSTFLTKVFMALGAKPKATASKDGMSALHVAGFLGADQVIPLLIKEGTPINLQDKEGRTALHLAAYAGQVSSVAALMEHKADPEVQEYVGQMTALHLAVSQKHSGVVQVLLEKGANPNPEDKNGNTPLLIAEHEDLGDIMDILREYNALK
jgi:ankyrin repeat protein